MPGQVAGIYWYNGDSSTPTLGAIPSVFNVIAVGFALGPGTGTPGGTISFTTSLGSGLGQSQASFLTDMAAKQAAGVKVLLAVGGANTNGFQMMNSTDESNLLSSFASIRSTFAFDGLVWDLEDGEVTWTSANVKSVSLSLKSTYGSSFLIATAPSGGTPATHWKAWAATMGSSLDWYMHQFYDYSATDTQRISDIKTTFDSLVNTTGLLPKQLVIGMRTYEPANPTFVMSAANYLAAFNQQRAKAGMSAIPGGIVWNAKQENLNSDDTANNAAPGFLNPSSAVALLKQNDLSGIASGTAPTNANSGGSSGDAFDTSYIFKELSATIVADTTAGRTAHGHALKYDSGATNAAGYVGWNSFGTLTTLYHRIYVYRPTATYSANNHIIRGESTAGTQSYRCSIDSTGHLFLANAAGTTVWTSTNTVPLDTIFRVELRALCSTTAGELEAWFYTGDSQTATETSGTIGSLVLGSQVTGVRMGNCLSNNVITQWYSALALDSSKIGPAGAVDSTVTGTATITATAATTQPATTSLTTTATISPTAGVGRPAVSTVSAAATITPAATLTAAGSASLTATASISATAAVGVVSSGSVSVPAQASISADASVTYAQTFFVGPTRTYAVRNEGLRYNISEGISVLLVNGAYQQVAYPTQEQLLAADKAYRGGYRTPITQQEADDLTAAGYGAYIVHG